MVLSNEPFNLRPWEIAKLTRYQVSNLYFCERDNNGLVALEQNSIVHKARNLIEDFKFINNLKPYMVP